MMKTLKSLLFSLFALATVLVISSCGEEKKTDAEEVADEIGDAIEEVADEVGDAARELKE